MSENSSPSEMGKSISSTGKTGRRGMYLLFTVCVIVVIALAVGKWAISNGTISGSAWVTKGNGQSDLLRGVEIVLCDDKISDFTFIRKDDAETASSLRSIHELWFNRQASLIAKHVVKTTKTDVKGKYIIKDVPAGSYLIYARYSSAFSSAYWLTPVRMGSRSSVHLDIDNSNMADVWNIPAGD